MEKVLLLCTAEAVCSENATLVENSREANWEILLGLVTKTDIIQFLHNTFAYWL